MSRRNLSLSIATVSSLTGICCLMMMFGGMKNLPDILGAMLMFITWGGSLASYIIGGGFGTALKWAWGVAKIGWFLVPVFPVDICTGMIGLVLGLLGLLFLPVFPVMAGGRNFDRA